MSNRSDLWKRLAAQARRSAEPPPQPDPVLVARIVGRWGRARSPESQAVDAWEVLGFRAALAAGIVMLVALLFSSSTISEALGQGLSFFPEVGQVEVVP